MSTRIAKYATLVSVFFLALGWLVFLFSAIGLFYRETIILSIVAAFLFLLYIRKYNALPSAQDSGKTSIFVILVALVVCFAACYFTTPTVFGGRDQGSIATAAIELSKNHGLKIANPIAQDLFQKYGPGKSLNFPGFDYTKNGNLISRFPVGYTAYLSANFNLFGLKGIQYANLIPFFLFLVLFWLTLREFFNESVSFLGFLLAATFFPFLWFAKYALTEIFILFLVWAGIYFLILFRRGLTSTITLCASLAFFALSSLVRIEGIIFFLLAAAYIIVLNRKKIAKLPGNSRKYLIISSVLLIAVYMFLNFPALSDSLKNIAKAFLANSGEESTPSANLYFYLFRVFFSYNILAFLILGLAGIVWLGAKMKKNWARAEFLPLFLTFPAFFYLLSPQITLDDPWLLRRFVFAVFPVIIFYSVYALSRFFYHKIFLYIVLAGLIVGNIAVNSRFLTLSENKNLLPQIEKISEKFESDDLVLVDRLATGSGFSLMSEPLRTIYGKNAVYFFNAEDLRFIDQDRYKNVFLVAPFLEAGENFWGKGLEADKKFEVIEVSNNFLEPPARYATQRNADGSERDFGLAQNVETKNPIGIWKIK
jgi:hypothetical protein